MEPAGTKGPESPEVRTRGQRPVRPVALALALAVVGGGIGAAVGFWTVPPTSVSQGLIGMTWPRSWRIDGTTGSMPNMPHCS